MQNKWIKRFVRMALLLLLIGVFTWMHAASGEQVVAHHMAPNDYHLTVGNLNEAMVHKGMPDLMIEIGQGELLRADITWGMVNPEP